MIHLQIAQSKGVKAMKTKRTLVTLRTVTLLVALFGLGITTANAEAPALIPYQGRLTDKAGRPVNATLSMTFALYAVPTGGTAAWIEAHPNIQVVDGLFIAYLGETVPLSSGVLNDNPYLGLTVGSDSEMTPRQQWGSVPYARTLTPGAEIRGLSSSSALIQVSNGGMGAPPGPGISASGNPGVVGSSTSAPGVAGSSGSGWGVVGNSVSGTGIVGAAGSVGLGGPGLEPALALPDAKAGVLGVSSIGPGGYFTATTTALYATSLDGPAIRAELSISGQGTHGFNHTIVASGGGVQGFAALLGLGQGGPGMLGRSQNGSAVVGQAGTSGGGPLSDPLRSLAQNTRAGVMGYSTTGPGVFASSTITHALVVSGTAHITGDLFVGGSINPSADVAEHYVAVGALEAGTVVVLDPSTPLGVRRADQPYDTAVAGIVSTDPAIVLPGPVDGIPLALVGRVPVKTDASYGAIRVGDLLTTSATPGHAMRCADRLQCVGAIIGKALQPLDTGTGVILMLVTLQ
jgi:hypothetical protein